MVEADMEEAALATAEVTEAVAGRLEDHQEAMEGADNK
jgi:hypothetical protein